MGKRWGIVLGTLGLLAVMPALAERAEASHTADNPKKHKIVYHFNGADDGNHVKKAKAVLGNIQNHVKGVGGWDNIEALVLVIHGDGVLPFIEKGMDPEVRKRYDLLTVGAMKMGV
jgi:intracellular sulfur oxidation DsrE/DsrF family protein